MSPHMSPNMATLVCDYQANNGTEPDLNEGLISKLHDATTIVSKSMVIAVLLFALLTLGCLLTTASSRVASHNFNGFETLPVLLRDLVDEGLIKRGQKGFVLGDIDCDFGLLRDNGIDVSIGELKMAEPKTFDFVFAPRTFGLIDTLLKDGGLVISLLGHDPVKHLENYKVVYLRRFQSTVVAMRKLGKGKATKRKQVFCGVASDEQKKAALNGLEDVYLEPPRRAAIGKKSRKIKFLPDLLKDSLSGYPRRFFISDDSSALDWFYKNYPMRDQEFQVYDVRKTSEPRIARLENRKAKESGAHQVTTGVSGWLAKHVRREDYVVMKAEAQVVEEMLMENTINLVDELFLECKHQWQQGGGEKQGKRAYWQCLALYGKVRDEGIAVHQWWS